MTNHREQIEDGRRGDGVIRLLESFSGGSQNMAAIRAYMDESGTHKDSHNSVFGGYWGSANQWKRFCTNWGRVLHRFGAREFHAREFWKRNPHGGGVGEKYRGWDRGKLDDFLEQLLQVIENANIYPFASGVLSQEWLKRSPFERRVFTGASDDYPSGAPTRSQYLGFQICVMRVASYCPKGARAKFICDADLKSIAWTGHCYEGMKQRARKDGDELVQKLGAISHADSEEEFPLQAADLIVYEAHKWAKGAYSTGDKDYPMSQAYRRALTHARDRNDFWLFDAPRFENMIRSIRKAAGV